MTRQSVISPAIFRATPPVRRRPGGFLARAGVVLAAAGLATAGLVAAAPAASAAACTGVSVVVDFGSLGGGAQTGCFAGDPTSGLQALSGAGFGYTFAPRQPGLVCQINVRPNPCNGAPTNAYWSYWHAQPGGSWVYSTTGAGGRNPAPGTVDGWAFGAGGAPGIAPPAAAAPPPAQQPAPPQPVPPPAAKPQPVPPAAKPAPQGATTPGAPTPGAPAETPAAIPTPDAQPSATGGSAVATSSSTAAAAPAPQGGADPSDGGGGGVPYGLIGGLALVAALGGAAFWTARRRAGTPDPM